MLTLDDIDPGNFDQPVCVMEYLAERGLLESVAVSITMHVMLLNMIAPPSLIREAAIDLGYDVPDLAVAPARPLSDRN